MELFDDLKKEIAWFKLNRAIAQERKAYEKERRRLYDYFHSPKGNEHLQQILLKYGIQETHNPRVIEIGKNNEQVFSVEVDQEEFLKAIETRKPEEIDYKVEGVRDEGSGGSFYIKLEDKIVIEGGGSIDDVSGAETFMNKLWNLSYRARKGEHPTYEQRWSKLHRQSPAITT